MKFLTTTALVLGVIVTVNTSVMAHDYPCPGYEQSQNIFRWVMTPSPSGAATYNWIGTYNQNGWIPSGAGQLPGSMSINITTQEPPVIHRMYPSITVSTDEQTKKETVIVLCNYVFNDRSETDPRVTSLHQVVPYLKKECSVNAKIIGWSCNH